MLAIIKENAGPGYLIKQIEIPKPKYDEVLIKVKVVGICGTDVPILKGLREIPLPLIPGHEFAGDIVEVGSNVYKFKVGDKVTASIVIGCGHCYYCRKGLETLCDNIIETGIHVDGAFADYVVVPEKVLHLMPVDMTYEQAASIDPIASAYHPIKKANIGSEDTVLIYGPGPIGLYAIQLAKAEGAKKIIMVGIESDVKRLELAKKLGADHVLILSSVDLLRSIKELTDGKLADIVVDATGSHDVFHMAIDHVRKHGQIILVGISHELSTIDTRQIVRKEIIVKGSLCYTWDDYKECMDLVNCGKIKIEPLISHKFKLEEMNKAMEVIDQKRSIKVMMYP